MIHVHLQQLKCHLKLRKKSLKTFFQKTANACMTHYQVKYFRRLSKDIQTIQY